MKTKIIPFDLETAKKIQAGEIDGKILNNLKNEVRIVCFDREDAMAPIIALFKVDGGEGVMYVRNDGHAVNCRDILVLELPDNEPQEELKQNFETVAESDAYWESYKNGFEAGRCVASDDNKCMTLKANEPQFKPFDKVLVRQSDKDDWRIALYSHFNAKENLHVTAWLNWYQYIPYESNERLVGTTDKPKELC